MFYGQQKMAFYSATKGLQDFANDGDGLSVCFGQSFDQMREKCPDVELLPSETALNRAWADDVARFTKPPVEIDRERYEYMLEVLPPVGWVGYNGASVFKMSERDCGNITGIFCKDGEKYYEMHDSIYMKPADIVAKCRAAAL